MKYQEYNIRKAAKFLGMKIKDFKALQDVNQKQFEALMLGAITLSSGIEFGAALFSQRHMWKPERKELLDRISELEKLLASKE